MQSLDLARWPPAPRCLLGVTLAASAFLGSNSVLAQDEGGRVTARYGYSITFGELKALSPTQIVATTQLKLCAKPTGYRWGYIITPPDNKTAYHEFMVVFAPPAASVKPDGSLGPNAEPQVLDVGTHTGASTNENWFDKEDIPGTWQIRIHVGTEEVGRITFDVLPAQSCP